MPVGLAPGGTGTIVKVMVLLRHASVHACASHVLLLLCLIVQPQASLAADRPYCVELQTIIAAGRTGFADLAGASAGADGRYPATLVPRQASTCSVSRPPGTASYHCVWEFPLQKPAAYARYNSIEKDTDACIGSQATPQDDQGVNHPDFYAARRFELEGTAVIVSVKDKSVLNRTLVKLWVVVTP